MALIEAVRIAKLLSQPLDGEARKQLLASSTGMAAALIQVMATPAYAALKDSSLALRWRLIGGTLGSVGAFVGVLSSVTKIDDALSKTQYGAVALYIITTVGNVLIGSAIVFSAITSAAPLLERATASFGVKSMLAGVSAISRRALALAGARLVGWLTGWEAMVAITALQFLASYLMPDPLRVWFARCAFGSGELVSCNLIS